MRSVVLSYSDSAALVAAVSAAGSADETVLPVDDAVAEGEWVLASFHLGDGRELAVAARATTPSARSSRLSFTARDAARVHDFARGIVAPEERISVPPRSERISHPPASGVGARVLFVDDDAELCIVSRAQLDAVGLVTTTAGSAEEGLERFAESSFDLIVVDWRLPALSGIDLCRSVRAGHRSPRIPIVFVSGNDAPKDMMEAFASGADDYVLKPFRASELSARIFALLGRAARASVFP